MQKLIRLPLLLLTVQKPYKNHCLMQVILRCPDLLQQAMSDLTAEVLHYPAWMVVTAKIELHPKKQVLQLVFVLTQDCQWQAQLVTFPLTMMICVVGLNRTCLFPITCQKWTRTFHVPGIKILNVRCTDQTLLTPQLEVKASS